MVLAADRAMASPLINIFHRLSVVIFLHVVCIDFVCLCVWYVHMCARVCFSCFSLHGFVDSVYVCMCEHVRVCTYMNLHVRMCVCVREKQSVCECECEYA